ncbi:MAG: cysteine--tRNA ligase [Nitrospiria bacterium]
MVIKITNSYTGKKENWAPRVPGKASLYVCGVTVYDHCHLGHARSSIIFDVVRHYLEYKGLNVTYVKNYTDIDDKIIKRANEEGKDWKDISDKYIVAYEHDMARLGVQPPTKAPRATEHMSNIIDLIDGLIKKELAYEVDRDVYFEVKTFPAYGKLSKRNLDEMVPGSRVAVNVRKKDPLDFALWKGSNPGEPAWESPWGMGRPGWHIECSAMAIQHLGETFDLHGGGEDLIFPHHENEIAQSEGSTGKQYVGCWIHHGFVTIDQEKMSKSLGNFFTVHEIFEKWSQFPEAVTSEVIRYYLLSTHYRSPIDFSDQSLNVAKSGLDNFYTLFQKVDEISTDFRDVRTGEDLDLSTFRTDFETAMDDDFNSAKAISILQSLRLEMNRRLGTEEKNWVLQACSLLKELGSVLGLFGVSKWHFKAGARVRTWHEILSENADEDKVQNLIRERELARKEKNWVRSDAIRLQLADAGIVIEDRPDGTTRIKR